MPSFSILGLQQQSFPPLSLSSSEAKCDSTCDSTASGIMGQSATPQISNKKTNEEPRVFHSVEPDGNQVRSMDSANNPSPHLLQHTGAITNNEQKTILPTAKHSPLTLTTSLSPNAHRPQKRSSLSGIATLGLDLESQEENGQADSYSSMYLSNLGLSQQQRRRTSLGEHLISCSSRSSFGSSDSVSPQKRFSSPAGSIVEVESPNSSAMCSSRPTMDLALKFGGPSFRLSDRESCGSDQEEQGKKIEGGSLNFNAGLIAQGMTRTSEPVAYHNDMDKGVINQKISSLPHQHPVHCGRDLISPTLARNDSGMFCCARMQTKEGTKLYYQYYFYF